MAALQYAPDPGMPLAGLVEAATAASEQEQSGLGKRKRDEDGETEEPSLQNSAAVLFREPSAKSKKYSRPPLGKVYTSLELAPEVFLRLQTACKEFMLDPAHPDRLEVVGYRRHTSGTDIAKLKLYNCVEEFLGVAGNGELFFGHEAGPDYAGVPSRTMFWPEDAQKIIKFCMPLMRKMVTNERQRQYAATTRKSGVQKEPTEPSTVDEVEMAQDAMDAAQEVEVGEKVTRSDAVAEGVNLIVNVMSHNGASMMRLIPRFSLSPNVATNLAALRSEVKKRMKRGVKANVDQGAVKVWLADGVVPVNDDGEWMVALLSAGTVEWMDGEVRVLIEV